MSIEVSRSGSALGFAAEGGLLGAGMGEEAAGATAGAGTRGEGIGVGVGTGTATGGGDIGSGVGDGDVGGGFETICAGGGDMVMFEGAGLGLGLPTGGGIAIEGEEELLQTARYNSAHIQVDKCERALLSFFQESVPTTTGSRLKIEKSYLHNFQ